MTASTTSPKSATEAEQKERIKTRVFSTASEASAQLAEQIAEMIRAKEASGQSLVLGLATGSTPVKLYRRLIRLHQEEGLSFRNVVTFNLDEYFGLERSHPESYWQFMQDQFFAHVDLPAKNIHLPRGDVDRSEAYQHCREYEDAIQAAGGIDLQILGIGRTGHIGFNEPGSGPESRTRLVRLDSLTRRDAARDFLGEANVPRYAITMGVGTILEARRVVLLAWGGGKSGVVARAVEEEPSSSLPASFLQDHPDVSFLIDQAAASGLTRFRHPWLVGPVPWTPKLARKAVVWLGETLSKPVLRLVEEEYGEHSLSELITEQGTAYNLNIRIFNELQHTLTGWPGGKPHADDTNRPERADPPSKRVLVLSPEPQDAERGMGGTLHRLVDQGHQVTLAYQTSGNLAVPDSEARMANDLVRELARVSDDSASEGSASLAKTIDAQLRAKGRFDQDSRELRLLKGLIRRSEARAACQTCGLAVDRVRFLDLPFYEQGRYRQFRIQDEDVKAVVALLRAEKPHQVFATGSLADPSSVAGTCFEILRRALQQVEGDAWFADCWIWIYREGDQAWDLHELDMAVPLSPDELTNKVQAIYQHQSQRSQTPATVSGLREVWQQTIDTNRGTAERYDGLGLPEYEALETFRRWESIT